MTTKRHQHLQLIVSDGGHGWQTVCENSHLTPWRSGIDATPSGREACAERASMCRVRVPAGVITTPRLKSISVPGTGCTPNGINRGGIRASLWGKQQQKENENVV